jgi:hypothetical protein
MSKRLFHAVLATVALFGASAFVGVQARAAQAWSCICYGASKRFLASTRHCEFRNTLPAGQSCSLAQWRAVYGPACRAKGCRLPPLKAASGS